MISLRIIHCFIFYIALTLVSTFPLSETKRSNMQNSNHKIYQEAEYDVTLDKVPEQTQYFVRPEEFQEYEDQFEKIKNLGEEIMCKLHDGECGRKKRQKFIRQKESNVLGARKSFHSMLDDPNDQQSIVDSNHALMSPISPELERDALSKFGPDDRYVQQHKAVQYGQQPQMDIKLPPVGAMAGMPDSSYDAAPPGSMVPSPSDTYLQLQQEHQQNDATIQASIQNKIAFMDQANKEKDGNTFGAPADQSSEILKFGSRDENPEDSIGGGLTDGNTPEGMSNVGGSSVSENDILKAEGIQPNEINDLHNFIKSSNEVNTHNTGDDAEMTNGKFMSNENGRLNEPDMAPGFGSPGFNNAANFGKTKVDFGVHPQVENNEAGGFMRHETQIKPGGPEVPVLANLLGGVDPSGTDEPLSLKFVEDNTKDMMQSNSDYKLPQTAFSNLWRDFMSSTQSQLGQLDPSANSRETIMPSGKAKKKSDVNKRRWKKSDGKKKNHSVPKQ